MFQSFDGCAASFNAWLNTANELRQDRWAGAPSAPVQEVFARPGLPLDEPLSLLADVRANGAWCKEIGGWSRGMHLDGRALVPFLPPGDACSYEPLEISVGPEDIVSCYNISK